MHVPEFLIRQVFVNFELAAISLLSGKFTSATKDARFVQSAELVGIGVSGVTVAGFCARDVTVAVGGASVAGATGADVSVDIGMTVPVALCPSQAEITNISKVEINRNFFFM